MSDPTLDAYYRLACRLLLCARASAGKGSLEARIWIMSPEGEAFMEGLNLSPCAVRRRLVDEWAQWGLKRIVAGLLKKPGKYAILKVRVQ